jgi:histone H3/H4
MYGGIKLPEVSLASMGRLLKRTDPSIRASIQSKEELRSSVEDYGARIAEIAVSIAKHANRSTVLPQDIVAAREQLMVGVGFHQTQLGK